MEKVGTIDFEQLGILARKAQGGDGVSYESLLKQLDTYIHRVLRARLGSVAELDDLTQECLLGMHHSLPSYHPSRNIRPWIHAIIRYKMADHFRSLARRKEIPKSVDMLDLASGGTAGKGSLLEPLDMDELLTHLPAPLRRAVVLTKLEGLSCDDAARQENISAAALRKRVSRAYRKLAVLIEKELG